MTTITFLGAAGEVTGSSYLVCTNQSQVLVDYGLFQGTPQAELRNRSVEKIDASKLGAVVITHAHLDHTGRLPVLAKNGFRGPIHCTAATMEMTLLVLRDSARLQESDADRYNRKRQHSDAPPQTPLYTSADVELLVDLFKIHPYETPVNILTDLAVKFHEAGHILGSTSVSIELKEGKAILFSGDLGPLDLPLLKASLAPRKSFDTVIVESTYGDRNHRSLQATVDELVEVITQASHKSGKVLIPAFAIGRTQQLLYHLAELTVKNRIPKISIYLDSPMGAAATGAYLKHEELLDAEARALLSTPAFKNALRAVNVCTSVEDSKRLNDDPNPGIIIAGSGMCTGGRIVHHLRNHLPREEATVVIAGFQAEGTLGRRLVDGAEQVNILGSSVPVNASIRTLGGFSAHAGQEELLAWIAPFAKPGSKICLTHGEDRARGALSREMQKRFSLTPELPRYLASIEI